MASSQQEGEKAAGLNTILYRETIPYGVVYHTIMLAMILVLFALLLIFAATKLYAGVIALSVTLPFIIWVYIGCRKTELIVTTEEFRINYWLTKVKVRVSDMASVQVEERLVLPPPYQGHIKVGYGWHSWPDLKVMVCRKGLQVLEMRKKNGVTVIVTPLNADKVAGMLHQQIAESRINEMSTDIQ